MYIPAKNIAVTADTVKSMRRSLKSHEKKHVVVKYICMGVLLSVVLQHAYALSPDDKRKSSEVFIQKIMSGSIVLRGVHSLLPVLKDNADEERIKAYFSDIKHTRRCNHIVLQIWPGSGLYEHELKNLPLIQFPIKDAKDHFWHPRSAIMKQRWFKFFKEIDLPVILYLDPKVQDFGKLGGGLWTNKGLQDGYVDFIAAGAGSFSDTDIVIGYCLLNEPAPPGSFRLKKERNNFDMVWSAKKAQEEVENGDKVFSQLMNRTIRRIREHDAKRILFIQPGPLSQPWGLPQCLDIIPDERLAFRYHHYYNYDFTHQNITAWNKKDTALLSAYAMAYPSSLTGAPEQVAVELDDGQRIYKKKFIAGKEFIDREGMEVQMNAVLDFQKQREAVTGKKCIIHVTEFGTVRWIDQASQLAWYEDSLDLFESHRWGWSYFGFWPWSYDHTQLQLHDLWACTGPEGTAVDIRAYISNYSKGSLEHFRKEGNTRFRESFLTVLNYMRKNE